jgi:peptide/nickel transport system permease protein
MFTIILVFFVLTVNFIIFELMPGNPMEIFASAKMITDEATRNKIAAMFGLDQPPHIRFVLYIRNMLTGNFGISYQHHKDVSAFIMTRLINTLALVGLSTMTSIIFGIALGVLAAWKRGTIFDNAAVIISLITYSLPSFWMGMIMILIFSHYLGWFPNAGIVPPDWTAHWPTNPLVEISGRLYHLFLPVLTLTLFQYGGYLLLTRATMTEALTEDYILTARAKGLRERTVLFKHALKNASLPLITNVALSFGFLLSGAIITEQVFTYPGLGLSIWQAISYADYPVLQSMFFIIALCVIIANLVADLLYGVIDPRIKYG